MFERVAHNSESGRAVYKWLNDIKFTTRSGKKLTLSGVYRILNETFYYGEFEYPVGGGKYYKGNHDSIITKELFIKARENLTAPPRRHPGTIDFAFTKLLYCGACGSGISAEEKFKHQKNGNTHRYVYYHCTRGKDRDCQEGAIREEDLLSQLVILADKIDINEIAIKEQIKKEVERFRKFSYGVLGKDINLPKRSLEIDMRNYIKYILADGTKEEKRELLTSLKSKLTLKDKKLELN
jgi:hypothetical protein